VNFITVFFPQHPQWLAASSGCHVLMLPQLGQSQFTGGLGKSCAHLGHLAFQNFVVPVSLVTFSVAMRNYLI
jgi:hypothetical protein